MRKHVMGSMERNASASDADWLDLDRLAAVEVTSEEAAHPIEAALVPRNAETPGGWRAAEPGPQVVRLRFDEPQRLRRIRLQIDEAGAERTQELAVRWSADGGRSFHDVVRQQWTFSPNGATRETEDYRVELSGVTVVELVITPNIGGGAARASLTEMRLSS
jgi:hypothetical protein